MIEKKRDFSLDLIRGASCFLIILTHILEKIPKITFLAQVTNSAVFTFLFLSGFLFGNKEINDFKRWIKKRLRTVLIPVYVYLIVFFVINNLLKNNYPVQTKLRYFLNVQGFGIAIREE